MERAAVLTDEHVPSVFTSVLDSREFDVVTVRERYGQGSIDATIIDDCADESRIVVRTTGTSPGWQPNETTPVSDCTLTARYS
jgi:hypothetical protein